MPSVTVYHWLVIAKGVSLMPTIQIETDQLLQAALQMSREELEQFVARLFALKARQDTPSLSERETELLMKINQGLPSAMQGRLNELIDKRQSYTITQDELKELIQLTDQVEMFDVERLKHLIELAHLRGVTLDELIRKLGIKPVPHD
jgi:hypothetical protein